MFIYLNRTHAHTRPTVHFTFLSVTHAVYVVKVLKNRLFTFLSVSCNWPIAWHVFLIPLYGVTRHRIHDLTENLIIFVQVFFLFFLFYFSFYMQYLMNAWVNVLENFRDDRKVVGLCKSIFVLMTSIPVVNNFGFLFFLKMWLIC